MINFTCIWLLRVHKMTHRAQLVAKKSKHLCTFWGKCCGTMSTPHRIPGAYTLEPEKLCRISSVGRVVSEEVIVQLLKSKCLPFYIMAWTHVHWTVIKLSHWSSQSTAVLGRFSALDHKLWLKSVKCCFTVRPSLTKNKYKFLHKYIYLDNELCKVFNDRAIADLSIRSCLAVSWCHYSVVTIS